MDTYMDNDVPTETQAVSPDSTVPTTEDESIERLLKSSIAQGRVVRGVKEVVKSIEAKHAKVVFLSTACENDKYKNLVKALCKHNGVPLVEIRDSKQLGEWVKLCKIDREGKPRKIIATSSCAILDFGYDRLAWDYLREKVLKV